VSATKKQPTTWVANSDLRLLDFLIALDDDGIEVALLLADWLTDHGDARAEIVREIAQAHCVLPGLVPNGGDERLMARGRCWSIALRHDGVTARILPGGPLDSGASGVEVELRGRLLRPEQTPEGLRAAFDDLRRALIAGLFGFSLVRLERLRVVLRSPDFAAVAACLRYGWDLIPYLCTLKNADPARLDRFLAHLWSDERQHRLGYAIMDALDPDWRRQRLTVGGRAGDRPLEKTT
jgi:hypothetical protein